jgi:hypothetical protein
VRTAALFLVITAAACGKKAAGPSDAGAAGTARPSAGAPASQPLRTAEGEAPTATAAVGDCPKSLSGHEDVARTIKKACGPIPITGDYSNDGGLTLEAGVVLRVADNAAIEIGYNKAAKLIVQGTDQEPVLLTSAGDAVPGAWKGLTLYRNATRSRIEGLVVENAGTGGDATGAIHIEAADVTLKGSTVRNVNGIGLWVDGAGRFAEMSGNRFEKTSAVAASVTAPVLGGLGANRFDAGATVLVRGGHVEEDAKWQSAGAPYVVVDDINVDGRNGRATLEILAGTELRFKNTGIDVGYNSDAVLAISGSSDKPVVLTGADGQEPGAWKGIATYAHGELRVTGATFQYAGAKEDTGAIDVDAAPVAIAGSIFKDDARSVVLHPGAKLKKLENNSFGASKGPALSLSPDQVGGIGAGNRFDKDARIEVGGGPVKESATWAPQTVPYDVTGEISVGGKATLTLEPGVELVFGENQQLSVGYDDDGTLKAVGAADRPVTLRGLRADGPWKGVTLYGHARGCELQNVALSGVTGDAGIIVERDAEAKVADVSCARCMAATLTSQCGAKLAASGVKAGDGTPKDEIKPTCQ